MFTSPTSWRNRFGNLQSKKRTSAEYNIEPSRFSRSEYPTNNSLSTQFSIPPYFCSSLERFPFPNISYRIFFLPQNDPYWPYSQVPGERYFKWSRFTNSTRHSLANTSLYPAFSYGKSVCEAVLQFNRSKIQPINCSGHWSKLHGMRETHGGNIISFVNCWKWSGKTEPLVSWP